MKKLLLSLGALSAVVAPVAAVVACGSDSKDPVTPAKAATPAAVDAKTLESNEVWNQTPGTRVFHVGFKIDGAAKHKTAGTVVALDPADKGSYGFHGLFGFLKHATIAKAEGTMFVVGDQVVLNVDGTKEYTYKFDAAGVKVFTDLLAKLRGLDATVFSSLTAAKHPGTALIQTPIEAGVSIQTKALEDLLTLLKVSAADKTTVEGWASPHFIAPKRTTVKTFELDEAVSQAPWHAAFHGHDLIIGDTLKIGTHTLLVDASNIDRFNSINYGNMNSEGAAIKELIMGQA